MKYSLTVCITEPGRQEIFTIGSRKGIPLDETTKTLTRELLYRIVHATVAEMERRGIPHRMTERAQLPKTGKTALVEASGTLSKMEQAIVDEAIRQTRPKPKEGR